MAVLRVNGVDLPCPTGGLNYILTAAVNDGRNAQAEMIGEMVGRRQIKLNNLEWKWITPEQATQMAQLFDNFFVYAEFWSVLHGGWVKLKMYPGDFTIEPYYGFQNGEPTRILSFKVNIIDCGIL